MSYNGIVKSYSFTQQNASGAYFARDGSGGIYLNGNIYLLGGWNASHSPKTNAEIWVSSNNGTSFTQTTDAAWERCHTFPLVYWNSKWWKIGGDVQLDHYQNTIYSSPDALTWTLELSNVTQLKRTLHWAVVYNNVLYFGGGQKLSVTGDTSEAIYNDVYKLEYVNSVLTVTTVNTNTSMSGRSALTPVVKDNKVWFICGGIYPMTGYSWTAYSDVITTTDFQTFTTISTGQLTARFYHNVTVLDNMLIVYGGSVDASTNTSDCVYSFDGVVWRAFTSSPPLKRHAGTLIDIPNGFIIANGSSDTSGSQYPLNDCWILNRTEKAF